MLFMVVENYRPGSAAHIYERVKERGRMIPAGLEYVDSWVDMKVSKCFQLMKTDDPALLNQWIESWSDLVEFEVVQVQSSSDAAKSTSAREQEVSV
jgi:hypothetical protein